MAAFYLDNDVPLALARELQGLGHQVASTRGRGLQRAGDETQLPTAAERAEVLVTCNRCYRYRLDRGWELRT